AGRMLNSKHALNEEKENNIALLFFKGALISKILL
ncbi:MAG: hypothetical protein ACI8X3_002952, partial [Saprospiraceae bacterium]